VRQGHLRKIWPQRPKWSGSRYGLPSRHQPRPLVCLVRWPVVFDTRPLPVHRFQCIFWSEHIWTLRPGKRSKVRIRHDDWQDHRTTYAGMTETVCCAAT
jgi:hypothetical protein